MTQAKQKVSYTPGPWRAQRQVERFDDSTLDHPYWEIVLSDMPNQRRAGYVARVDGMRDATQEANARAIAAVPELITVLQEELDAIRVWLCKESNADITDGMFISIDKIKTALTKAGVL